MNMLAASEPQANHSTISNLAFHTGNNSWAMTDRIGKLQFSIVASAMYTSLVQLHRRALKTPEAKHKEFKRIAAEWLKLAKPLNAVTKDDSSFMNHVVPECARMKASPFQYPMEDLIEELRDALVAAYTHNSLESSSKEGVKEIISSVESLYLKVAFLEDGDHARGPGAVVDQAAAADSMPSMLAGVFGRPLSSMDQSTYDAQMARLNGMIQTLRGANPPKTDMSAGWKSTYLALIHQVQPADDAAFKEYLRVSDALTHQDKPTPVDPTHSPTVAELNLIARLTTKRPGYGQAEKDTLKKLCADARAEFAKKHPHVEPQKMAMEWARLWGSQLVYMTSLSKSVLTTSNVIAYNWNETIITLMALSYQNQKKLAESILPVMGGNAFVGRWPKLIVTEQDEDANDAHGSVVQRVRA